MANEPRAYREVIAEAMHELRPALVIMTVEPEDMDGSVASFGPDIVICSAVTDLVESEVLAWVELYPEYGPQSVISVKGEVSKVNEIQLADLLCVVDRAERLLQKG